MTPNRNSQVEESRSIDRCESSTSNEEAGQPPRKPPKPLSSKINDYWIWEAVSCIISLIALAAIVGVLLEYDGKSIPDWPYGDHYQLRPLMDHPDPDSFYGCSSCIMSQPIEVDLFQHG